MRGPRSHARARAVTRKAYYAALQRVTGQFPRTRDAPGEKVNPLLHSVPYSQLSKNDLRHRANLGHKAVMLQVRAAASLSDD